VREFQEEIGVAPIDFRLLTVLDFSAEAGSPLHYALYRVGALAGPPLVANDEHSELRWFELTAAAALPDLASGHYRSIILEQRLETD
jgi:8-oxo-dGTP pyrophosphatase MutT (NUDIX family)